MDDTILNITYTYQVYNNSPLLAQIPAHTRWNVCIVAIASEEPIIYDYAEDEILQHQKRGRTNKTSIYFTQLTTPFLYNLQENRATFGQVRLIVGYSDFFTQKPLTSSDILKCRIGTLQRHWISGIFDIYDNIYLTTVFILPLTI